FYQKMFSLYGKTSGTPLAVLGCPFDAGGGAPAVSNDGNGCANRRSVSHSSDDHEQVQTARVDYNINENNTTWYRFQADTGLQAAYTDPINSLFDSVSPQPLYSFAAGYTRVFSQNLVNYFNPGFSWCECLHHARGPGQHLAPGKTRLAVFLNDNLAWSRGEHELRFGTNTRIFRLN